MTSIASKLLPFEEASAIFRQLRGEGLRVVQCHGTFDLVHPGHIFHLEEARALGDVLVVTITGEKYVNKGPGRPYFSDKLRAKSLAALACVDYVVVIPFRAAVEAIECVQPDIYCKGREYEDQSNDVTGNIADDIATVEKFGGRVSYIGSVVFSSTKLLNKHFDHMPEAIKGYCQSLAVTYPPDTFRQAVDDLKDLRVLLIGDIIFDKYSYVKVQGLTSKASIVSARHLYEDLQPGGTLAVYRHVREFTPHVKLVSILGTEPWAQEELDLHVAPEDSLVLRDETFTSVLKHRFVAPQAEGKELIKYFSVNYIDDKPPRAELIARVMETLRAEIEKADVVMVMDFGHGLMQPEVREFVQEHARFLAVNCQSNSNNHGFNIINRQYKRMDCFSLDETEMLLAVGQRHVNILDALEKLKENFSSSYAWLTRGGVETIGLKDGEKPSKLMPFEASITDTVGAGDAFFSIAALGAAKGYHNELVTFLGQLGGAQAVKIVGNTRPISKAVLLKAGMSLLNF
ncbi:cytidyltransferase [Verrucomicrobia bacterium LW23]|nr:cytidyltransferase [Verrucomicrobia bacterium LW23]